MARTNTRTRTYVAPKVTTYEGGPARILNARPQLRRAVLSCLLWENQFYESGEDIAKRIRDLTTSISKEDGGVRFIEDLAVEARSKYGLRHVPLWVANALSDERKLSRHLVPQIVQRADEMTELLAMYWAKGKKPLSNALRYGLAAAFPQFDAYQLSRYKQVGDSPISLRDVMFLTHPKPVEGRTAYTGKVRKEVEALKAAGEDPTTMSVDFGPKVALTLNEQEETWRKLATNELEPPDTWEVELSAGKDKKETFERLLRERKLGALALLRNLRNMAQVGVDEQLIFERLNWIDERARIWPFQFITAARFAPQWESQIEAAMLRNIAGVPKLPGRTVLLIDVSQSMDARLSLKGDMTREDAANGLAILAREVCEKVAIYTFSNGTKRVPDRHGFALRDAVHSSQPHGGTNLGQALTDIAKELRLDINGDGTAERIIVFTDGEARDEVGKPPARVGHMVNVAGYKHEVGFGDWVRVDGFSEQVLNFVREIEPAVESTD
jgi:60 kDa SS-A/Ro ribonucleoprotein